jgi:TonB-linked SusC/RagA family outer membrane protein
VLPETVNAQVQKVSGKITDEQGNAIAGAVVSAAEGRYTAVSDSAGQFTVNNNIIDDLYVEAAGFEPRLVSVSGMKAQNGVVQLTAALYMNERRDQVSVPFGTLSKRRIVGAVNNIQMDDYAGKYTDRNYWTLINATGLGMFSSTDVRGMGSTVVIDGLVRDGNSAVVNFSDMINANEIEEITVLKDAASKMLYGAMADKGIILIKTRHGEAHKRRMNFTYESSLGVPISYPNYLKAADYMILYNEANKNDGKPIVYSWEDIENTRNGSDPLTYPDVDYYRGHEFLDRVKPQQRLQADFSGGNRVAQYYLNMSYLNSRSLLKEGEGSKQSTNRFNVHGSINMQINDFIKASLDGMAIFNAYHGPYYKSVNFWNLSTSERVNAYPLLIPVDEVREEDREIVDEAVRQRSLIRGRYLAGGNRNFTQNLLGDLNLGGYDNTMDRLMNINIGIEVNLKKITDGLSFTTYFGSDNYNQYATRQINGYAVYNPTRQSDGAIALEKVGDNDFVGKQTMNNIAFYRRYGWINTLGYRRIFSEKHDINATLNSYMNTYKQSGFINTERHLNFGGRFNYMYDNRWIAEYSGAYIGSPYFRDGRRWGYAQSLGGGWILSEEDMLKNIQWLNWLKLKATWGNTKSYELSAFSGFHMFENTYTAGSAYNYGDGNGANNAMTITYGNGDLSWVQRNELNIGVETSLFNRWLFVEANYFNSLHYDIPERPVNAYPSYLGGANFIPVENYGRQREQGIEAGINFSRKIGELQLNIGAKAIYIVPKILVTDELAYNRDEQYLRKTGTSPFALWGLVAEGLYTQEEIDRINDPADGDVVRPGFGIVRAGDIKYLDQNNDKKIDNDDVRVLGSSHATANYGLTLNITWRQWNLFACFTAQTGISSFFRSNYYNVSGEMKYPAHLTGRWAYDPATGTDTRSTATYPRLTVSEDANNFRNSTYWLGSRNYLSMPALQLTYAFGDKITNALRMKTLNVFARGQNLFMAGPNADKLRLNVGSEPQMRWYYFGLTAEF